MNRSVYLLVGSLAIGVTAYANAEHDSIETLPSDEPYRAYARVISVDPIVTRRVTTEPETRCTWVREDQPRYYRDARGHWQHTYQQDRYQRRYEHHHRSGAPSIIGGLLGSLARIRHRYASWSRNEPDLVKSSALMIISSCRHGLRAPIAA